MLKQLPDETSHAEWATAAMIFVPLADDLLSEIVFTLGLPGLGDQVDFILRKMLFFTWPTLLIVSVHCQLNRREHEGLGVHHSSTYGLDSVGLTHA